jgi:hypothetical protein
MKVNISTFFICILSLIFQSCIYTSNSELDNKRSLLQANILKLKKELIISDYANNHDDDAKAIYHSLDSLDRVVYKMKLNEVNLMLEMTEISLIDIQRTK